MAESILDDAELVRRTRHGDVAAFRELVATHTEPLWWCARALCRDDHEAEDLAQETPVEAWRSLARFVQGVPRPLTPAAEVWINPPGKRPTVRTLELPRDTKFVPQLSQSH